MISTQIAELQKYRSKQGCWLTAYVRSSTENILSKKDCCTLESCYIHTAAIRPRLIICSLHRVCTELGRGSGVRMASPAVCAVRPSVHRRAMIMTLTIRSKGFVSSNQITCNLHIMILRRLAKYSRHATSPTSSAASPLMVYSAVRNTVPHRELGNIG